MAKKEKEIGVIIVLILALTLVSSGCSQKPKVDEQVINDLEAKNVSEVVVTISPTASDELKNDLRLLGLESYEGGTFTGIIDEIELKELQNKKEVLAVNKREIPEKSIRSDLPSGGNLGSESYQNTYEQLRREQNISVGPYVEREVEEQIEKTGHAYVVVGFHVGLDKKTYQNYTLSIKEYMEEDELKDTELAGIGRAFRAVINKDGLNKLKNDSRILNVLLVRA